MLLRSDARTASAFAESWNRLSPGSVYTREQFLDWFLPLGPRDFRGRSVLELGFGNGSLLVHMADCEPESLAGVELGETLDRARLNLSHFPAERLELHQGDLTKVDVGRFDVVYCIGVLHHLTDPASGFLSVLRHTKSGGRFHCWVYAHRGNAVVRAVVDPLRRVTSRLPWWLTKYGVALPLVCPYYAYAKLVSRIFPESAAPTVLSKCIPLLEYSRWICRREFPFFLHVAFDQLLTPRTVYLRESTIRSWLRNEDVDPESTYLRFRNGNSWVFGGRKVGIGAT